MSLATLVAKVYVDHIRDHLPPSDRRTVERIYRNHGILVRPKADLVHIPCSKKRNRRKN